VEDEHPDDGDEEALDEPCCQRVPS
jgi:hypothetical protein